MLNWSEGKVINLHYTDICNYRCRFCYARFGGTPLSLDAWKKIIDNILAEASVKRFNLAGGEPLASPYIQPLINYIHSCGIDCSIITNGSLLTSDFIQRNKGKLSMIGISADSFSHEDNINLGRINGAGKTLSFERIKMLSDTIHNSNIRLKINTVVNSINYERDFTNEISAIRPDRWKILRMIHINDINDDGDSLLVSDSQFNNFVNRHSTLNPVVENTQDIICAYILVNPMGELVNNSNGNYSTSKSLVTHSFSEEFSKLSFNEKAYQKRYVA